MTGRCRKYLWDISIYQLRMGGAQSAGGLPHLGEKVPLMSMIACVREAIPSDWGQIDAATIRPNSSMELPE